MKTVLSDMGIDAAAELSGLPGGRREYFISIEGDGASVLIGHHGETLDALQYLTNLAANRREDDESGSYTRITVDIGNYRAKREETLRRLARRTAEKVLKYKRNITLEPMSAYERRIIHSEVQNIAGVTTNSVGSDNNRRVVVSLDGQGRPARKKPAEQTAPAAPKAPRPLPKNKIQKRARFDETLPEYHAGDCYSGDAEIDRSRG